MAANLPDVDLTTLNSSAQIFSAAPSSSGQTLPSYTLPQIRALHKQIHLAIDDKKARLRTQVGGSYRELLGTADAIVRMRSDMDDVQGILGTMGARCGRGVVGGKVGGLARFTGEREGVVESGSGRRDLGGAARAKILAGCVLVLARLLKSFSRKGDNSQVVDGEQLVVAAKVLVLGRLLVRSFDESKPDVQDRAAVEASIQSLDRLRRRLRKSTDKVLEAVGETTSRQLVLRALCAYSLATNSGTRDVVRHFLDVRGSAMASVFDVEEHRSTVNVVRGLELYTKTILDVQFLVPNKLTEAIASLKREALLSSSSLRETEGLRLDIYERWCSEKIRGFKPSMSHDDLDGKRAVEMLTSWSSKGSQVLLAGLEKTLDRTTEFKILTEMRTEVLQLWIRDGGKARGFDPSVMLDKLRQTINAHVMGVLDAKVHKLRLVGSEVASTLEVWRAGVTDAQQRLWDVGSLDMDLHYGAGPFSQDVIGRLYGRNDAVARAVTGYKSWASVIDDVEEVVEQLKRQRWDNDVDEIEDEETIEQRQQALSRDDPAQLQQRLNVALERALRDLDKQLSELWTAHADGDKTGKVAMYLVRILRDIRAKLPKLEAVKGFGLDMVPSLQEKITSAVASAPVDDFASNALARKMVVGRSLWEGSPELPTSPSPGVFRLLRSLIMAMSDAGTDLWSPTAVSLLKDHVGKELSNRWMQVLDAHLAQSDVTVENEKSEVEEGEPKDEDEEATAAAQKVVADKLRKDLLVQWLFDIGLLKCSIPADELKTLEEAVWKEAEIEDTSARQRLNKASQEYWKRSSLLFGLLS
ncbi:hypothetical protein M406DRAFT_34571 [Cryphonectria parasitica EP155]|uniref:Conserved oligomeric Golgi complex subunit 1 n=1 Tax=Cryphonectria parasitica (strain ATCC 38755 / EP155) TaxID=660469 RepID=A0A9P4YBU0_CRYP1|nr:uncharacterized protein M406DRAFT_34571 [Cryphonectria parasitica EP155]KAF3770168.1 hypothetical protein M406DRAFT_34571 [Cryphonectria parasitica EP155]